MKCKRQNMAEAIKKLVKSMSEDEQLFFSMCYYYLLQNVGPYERGSREDDLFEDLQILVSLMHHKAEAQKDPTNLAVIVVEFIKKKRDIRSYPSCYIQLYRLKNLTIDQLVICVETQSHIISSSNEGFYIKVRQNWKIEQYEFLQHIAQVDKFNSSIFSEQKQLKEQLIQLFRSKTKTSVLKMLLTFNPNFDSEIIECVHWEFKERMKRKYQSSLNSFLYNY